MKRNDAFVFVVCGERHASRLNIALKFLRHFSRCDIIVVKGRTRLKVDCDRVIEPPIPAGLNNHQASIFLKTSLHRILAPEGRRFCYLDNDVIAVAGGVDAVFAHALPPISFAADHCDLQEFSRYAVRCDCTGRKCEHLHAAIGELFGVSVLDKAWRHWNGGVFVFDERSAEFMELWHRYTLAALRHPYWRERDQGSLAAAAWKLGLQQHPTLPREYNFIVDPYDGAPRAGRAGLKTRLLAPNETYSLDGEVKKPHPSLVHFINGGVGRHGWKNWDEAERLLAAAAPAASPAPPGALSDDNRRVHGLWIGSELSKLELLTIRSFLRHGHEFHLWLYQSLATPLPPGVVVEDANEIIPQSRIIRKADTDIETGVGKGSYSSPFSDLFRYKLLYEKGGYWVDMDVTCLRPFNFAEPYVFRSHRVGVVGNIMKCPRHSELMKVVSARVESQANAHSEWLMPNRVLSRAVRRLGLTRYIRSGIWNDESWWRAIRPLTLGVEPIPEGWFAIHWINEFWRMLKETGGVYRGRRLFEVVPDKENPKPGSALARLYAEYGGAAADRLNGGAARPSLDLPLNRPAPRQPAAPHFLMTSHLNVLLPSLARGGAERIVLDTLAGLRRRNATGKLFIVNRTRPSYAVEPADGIAVIPLDALDARAKLAAVATEVLASPEPLLFTHMIKADLLRSLWERGVETVPVIHNMRPSWQDPPAAFDHPKVPFIVAVSEAVAQQLRADGCPRPVVVLRHELQRWFNPDDQQENRRQIRERHGIADGTLVIGMVGAFKAQKAYTRAVRVLAKIRQLCPAKLMILGSWDHDWGYGRQAYEATCRLALELNVITDLLALGPVPDAERHFAAFDVYLNTSAYEGLSIALLEAVQTGCPIVTSDAGGNREALPERAVLVEDSADIDAYATGIVRVLQARDRILVQKPPDFDLVPRLWCLMGRYRRPDNFRPLAGRTGTLFLTDNLNIGGAQRSLVNLLERLPPGGKWLAVLQPVYCQEFLDSIESRGVPVLSVHNATDYLDQVERILSLVERLQVRTLCFWNADARLKLLLAKILPPESVRLVDVSPGPFLFLEMDGSGEFQRRISFRSADYWARLDHFVAKHSGGAPPGLPVDGGKVIMIPNGVPAAEATPPASPLPPPAFPKGVSPDLVIGAVCRITPRKRVDFLIDMMAELNAQLPGAALVVVGGVDPRHAEYWTNLLARLHAKGVANVHFAGPQAEVAPYLRLFKVLVMISDTPGCPNASLEAMAMGVPVIANSAGGTPDQVRHGVNGYLVGGQDPREMADHVRYLLANPKVQRRFGTAARSTVAKKFSMDQMVRRFQVLLETPVKAQSRIVRFSRPSHRLSSTFLESAESRHA